MSRRKTGKTIGTFRVNVNSTLSSKLIPPEVKKFFLKNSGLNDIFLNFNGDSEGNYFTLSAGQTIGPLTITSGSYINYATASLTSKLEAIFWDE